MGRKSGRSKNRQHQHPNHPSTSQSNDQGEDGKYQPNGSNSQESKKRIEMKRIDETNGKQETSNETRKERNETTRKHQEVPSQTGIVFSQNVSQLGAESVDDFAKTDEDKVFWKSVDKKLDYSPPSPLFPPMVRTGPPRLPPRIEEEPPTDILDAVFLSAQDCQYYLCRWFRGKNGDKPEYHHVSQEDLEKHCPRLLTEFMESIWGVQVSWNRHPVANSQKAEGERKRTVEEGRPVDGGKMKANRNRALLTETYQPDYPHQNIQNRKPPGTKATNPEGNSSAGPWRVPRGGTQAPKAGRASIQTNLAGHPLGDSRMSMGGHSAIHSSLPKPGRGVENNHMQMAGHDHDNGEVQTMGNTNGRKPTAACGIGNNGRVLKADSVAGDHHAPKADCGDGKKDANGDVGDGQALSTGPAVGGGHMQTAGSRVEGACAPTSLQTSSKQVGKDHVSRAPIPSLLTATFPKPPSPELDKLARTEAARQKAREQQARQQQAQLLHWLPSSLRQQAGSILGSPPLGVATGTRRRPIPANSNLRMPNVPIQFPPARGQPQDAAAGISQHAFAVPQLPRNRGAQMRDPVYEQALAAMGLRAPINGLGLPSILNNAQTLDAMRRVANDLPVPGGPVGTDAASMSSTSSSTTGRKGFGGNITQAAGKRGDHNSRGGGAASNR